MDTLELTARDLQVAGEKTGPGNYRLEVNGPGKDKRFALDLSDENTKAEIASKILGEIELEK